MKLVSLQATNRQTKQRQFFKFDLPSSQKKVVTSNSSLLDYYLQLCFDLNKTGDFDVALCFEADGQSYRLDKVFDGNAYQTQLFATFAHSQTQIAEGAGALTYVQTHFDIPLDEFTQGDYVSQQAIDSFQGNVSAFDDAYQVLQAYNKQQPTRQTACKVDGTALQQTNSQLAQVEAQLLQTRTQIAQAKASLSQNAVVAEVANQLALLRAEQDKLATNAQLVESMRHQLQIRDKVVAIVPKVGDLEALAQQRQQYQADYDNAQQQLSWQEAELQSISQQLAQKQNQTEVALDRQSKIDVINHELQVMSQLHEQNKQLSAQIEQLSQQKQLLLADKEIFTNKLVAIENDVMQCKQQLEQLSAPEKSVTDLLEGVKIDTKLEEIAAQIEILQTELTVKENQLAQKEASLVQQVKLFRSVAELDVTVSPIKAKDTILQVLDAKYSKLEEINQTLNVKLRNLQRAVEDYRYRITQLDASKAKLDAEYTQVSLRKQDEFKREVYFNAQRTAMDATAAYAVTASLDDFETQTIQREIDKRTANRDFLAQKASQLDGRIAEIKRHLTINLAEINTLRTEKANINDHYNQIVSQSRGEAVFNYLKALESNNGTKYLLDVQQDAVKSEAEAGEIKRAVEALRTKIQSLKERQARLVDNRSHIAHVGEHSVSTNQQVKDDLTVVADNLTAHYSLYQSIRQQLDSTEAQLLQLDATMAGLQGQLQFNQSQIDQSNQRAIQYAGTTDLQQAVSTFKYEVADVGDEAEMLKDAFDLAQKEVFKRRLQAEKLQWLLQGVTSDYNALYDYVQAQLQQHGVDAQSLNLGAINKHADQMRQTIAKYDKKQAEITSKLSHLQMLAKEGNLQVEGQPHQQLQALVATEQQLLEQKQLLEQSYQANVDALLSGAATTAVADVTSDSAVRRLVKGYVCSFVSTAEQLLAAFVPNCKLQLVGDVVQVYKDGSLLSYSQMPAKVKTAVYLCLLASSWQGQNGRWVVIDEIVGVTKAELTQMLAATNLSYVVAYTVINKEK